ncbi:MAG: nitroreductase family protein, partial [Lutibacter sp.]|nr:nitroreductase family protein [Lutibacter sp.]
TTIDDVNSYFDLEKETRSINETVISKFRQQLVKMFENMTLEQKQASAVNQAYITLGNLLTVCAVEKIDACPMEGFIPTKIDELLNLKSLNLKSILLLPVGFRADDDIMSTLRKVRKPLEEVVIEIS